MQMHSWDITILIVLLWFNIVYYSSLFHHKDSLSYGTIQKSSHYESSLFQYFLLIYYRPYSSCFLIY